MAMTHATNQWAELPAPCECGATGVRTVGQRMVDGDLWWDSEFSCPSCGMQLCEGFERGAPPEKVRQALLSEHGVAKLQLAAPPTSLVPVLKAIREASTPSLAQARALAEELSQAGLSGTLVEMELLRQQLLRGGRGSRAQVAARPPRTKAMAPSRPDSASSVVVDSVVASTYMSGAWPTHPSGT